MSSQGSEGSIRAMITAIGGMPEGTIGFNFEGKISAQDYETVLAPGLKQATETGEIRCLCVLGDDFDGYELSGLWADLKMGTDYEFHHRGAFKRIAVVSDADWIRHAVGALGWMAPGELKVFGGEELEDAKAWVAG